jgi:hypothetical protein
MRAALAAMHDAPLEILRLLAAQVYGRGAGGLLFFPLRIILILAD